MKYRLRISLGRHSTGQAPILRIPGGILQRRGAVCAIPQGKYLTGQAGVRHQASRLRIKEGIEMKSFDRIDQQPTAVDQPLLRLRNVYQDRRGGKDRRLGITHMDPALDRRKGERRMNNRRGRDRRTAAIHTDSRSDRRRSERRRKIAWFFK